MATSRRPAVKTAHPQFWALGRVSVSRANYAKLESAAAPHFMTTEEGGLILQLVNDGFLQVEQAGQMVRLVPGNMLVSDANNRNLPVAIDAADVTVVYIPKQHLIERGWTLETSRGPLLSDIASADMRAVTELIRCAAHLSNSTGIDLQQHIERQLLDLLEVILQAHAYLSGRRGAEAIVYRAKAFIQHNYKDVDLDAQRVAEAVSISHKHLQRLFSSQGLTVMRYVWKVRLDHAAAMLKRSKGGALTIQEVAWQCGFASPAHFSRTFKRMYGIAPSTMRQRRNR